MHALTRMLILSLIFSSFKLFALPSQISGKAVIDGSEIKVGDASNKGTVVVFLSAICPCSNSHIVELKKLKTDFPEYEFVGVHSNVDEGKELTIEYFKKVALPFPVVQDTGAVIANEFKAYKTPHAFVVLKDGSVRYEGGVSDSHELENAKKLLLRNALGELSRGEKVKVAQGRTLGCVISRGEKNVW